MNSRPASSSARAPFLVFEGLDGSGKSTLIKEVCAELTRSGKPFRLTREPGGTPLAEEIRRLLLKTEGESPVAETELLLYAASRAQHVAGVIKPSIANGEWILCDRFSASTVAFQCFARGLPRPEIDWLNAFAEQGAQPDLTILLDLSVEESQRRQSGRVSNGQSKDRMELEATAFHQSVREGYLAQARENPSGWLVLDATLPSEDMAAQVISIMKERGWLAS